MARKKSLSNDKIVLQHKGNFETLRRVFADGNACLMECTVKATNEKMAVICAVSFQEGKYVFTPFAAFFNGNPFEMLTPPMEVPSR
jgi:hypothetical protein